jgi:hypothetical protein
VTALEAAVVELIQAKLAGRKIMPPKPPAVTKPSDLMKALRQSIGHTGKPGRAICQEDDDPFKAETAQAPEPARPAMAVLITDLAAGTENQLSWVEIRSHLDRHCFHQKQFSVRELRRRRLSFNSYCSLPIG